MNKFVNTLDQIVIALDHVGSGLRHFVDGLNQSINALNHSIDDMIQFMSAYKRSVEEHCAKVAKQWKRQKRTGRPSIVEFVEPMSNENDRLVNQGGLFTRAPDGATLEDWARDNHHGYRRWIGKATIPNAERERVLKNLNRMNINHLSLFPDLAGASVFTNLSLMIPNY